MQTGEDLQGLRKIIDFTRFISLFILACHFYFTCYQAFFAWGWTAVITDRILMNLAKTGLFGSILMPKLFALLFLCVSLIGANGKKEEKISKKNITFYLLAGLFFYFGGQVFFMPAYLSTGLPCYI